MAAAGGPSVAQKRGSCELHQTLKGALAVVLAGGRGVRLGPLTERQTKPAVPFGGTYRIIDFPLSNCINSGIRRVAVLTQYRAHTLIQHVQRGWGFLRAELGEYVEVWPAQQQTSDESWYRGTADAVFQNLATIRDYGPELVLILAGDHVYKQDYSVMIAEHVASGADATVACVEVPVGLASSFGIVEVDASDHIVHFVEKPAVAPRVPGKRDRALASMGIYVFDAGYLLDELERDACLEKSSHDFGKDLIPYAVARGRVMAHRFERSCVLNEGTLHAYWRDVGTLDAYYEASLDLTKVTPDLDLYDPSWPIWTHQPQRPPAKFVFDDELRRGTAVDSVVAGGVVVSGARVRRSLLSTDVRVNSFADVVGSVLLPGAVVGRSVRLRRAIVDRGCVLPEGLVVGEDPVADARRFHRTEGGVTLVSSEMLRALEGGAGAT